MAIALFADGDFARIQNCDLTYSKNLQFKIISTIYVVLVIIRGGQVQKAGLFSPEQKKSGN